MFAGLAPEDWLLLRRAALEQRVSAGASVFREGDPPDGIFVVAEGLIQIVGPVGEQNAQHLARIRPGDFFGEMTLLEDKPRSANAVATQDSIIYFFPRAVVQALLVRSPLLALNLLREVSERLRQFNQQYTRELLQNERLAVVGQFARSVIHDLKNPLIVIRLTTDVLCADDSPPATRAAARARINRQVDRVTELINDIMEFTQMAQVSSELVPTDYRLFVEQTLADVRVDAEARSAIIELENPPPSLTIAINAKRLRRVFFNLVHNATDVMPDGGRIRFRFMDGGHEITTEVEDAGPGIPAAIKNRLFEPFATHGKNHGTGLGLSISKRIIEDHQGRIWARNEPGRGAVFSFSLPRHKGERVRH